MDSSKKGVCYCSVSKGGRLLYTFNNYNGDEEIENLAAQCLEKAPPHHKWYFQTMGKKTFCFLMEEDGYVYFAIAEETLGNTEALRFLQNLRTEFEKHARRGRSMSSLGSITALQEQLVPVIKNLITSLENVPGGDARWPALSDPSGPTNGQTEGGSSTRAPLLSKWDKRGKSRSKGRNKDIEMEEHRDSAQRGGDLEAPALLTKEFGSGRMMRGSNQSFQKKWCRLVRIILAVDGAVCLVLLVVWLVVCEGTKCIS